MSDNKPAHCPRCGNKLRTVYVHGHEQCFECCQVIDDCCQGETCDPETSNLSDLKVLWDGPRY